VASAHAHHAFSLVKWIGDNLWWLIIAVLWFGGAVAEWILGCFDAGLRAARHRAKIRHKRKLELIREQARAAAAMAAAQPAGARPLPGHCVHRRVVSVRDAEGAIVAWLCKNPGCDKQLPADWAVAAEDLP
jgi:hypothetical protein